MEVCPVCRSADGYPLTAGPDTLGPDVYYDCPVCGRFGLDHCSEADYLHSDSQRTTQRVRAALSHWLRLNESKTEKTTFLETGVIEQALEGKLSLPNPAQIALTIIRFVGDHVRASGERLEILPPEFPAILGATSRRAAVDLVEQLTERGLLHSIERNSSARYDAMDLDLTLEGWEAYQAEQEGKRTAGYGFLAMKFGDETLEALARNHLKPAISSLGYELVDMRDVAEPGIIDNIMRMRIRDANFVIVDLTHDNFGAYWEAGYAEGLGKPVLYICERKKFELKQTHFDTNHCTTIMWNAERPEDFCSELTATLQRALL